MNKKLIAPASVIAGLLALATGTLYLSSGKSAPTFAPQAFSATTSMDSGKTPQQTLNELVRGDTLTFECKGGLSIANGARLLLNTSHYRDKANVPVIVSSSMLPPGTTPELLKGRIISAKGQLSSYKDKPQWLASEVTIK